MFRWLSTFLTLSFAAMVGAFALTSSLTAQQPTPPDVPTGSGIKRNQEENLKFYKNFAEQVLRLAQKWEKSDTIEDKERAKTLRAALKLAEEKGLEKLFKEIIEGLNGNNPNFNDILGKDKKLINALTEILNILETEDDAARIRIEIKRIEDAIKAINKLKRDQENILGRTFNPKSDADKLAKDQADLKKATDAVAKALAKGADPNAKPGTPGGDPKEDPKSENKAEPKPGENTAENKADTKENKADTKADGMGMGGMPMDPKGAGAEAKPMGGMGMPMDGMSGGDKPAPKDGGMGGDPKGGEPKPMGGTPTEPKNPMNANPMGSEPKGGEPKPMSGEGKPQGAGKAESKPSAGMPGGEGKPMSSEGMGGMGMPMGGMGQPSPGGSKGGGSPPPPSGQQPQGGKKDPAAENVQQAVPSQQEAEDNIKKNENKNATKNQDDAIKKLEEAIKELEARLKQLREKELAKLLANLEQRVAAMIRMQTEVREATRNIAGTVKALGGKPAVAEIQKSQGEAENENKIIVIADATLKLMEGEGSAVVFAGVLKEVKGDMEAIQKRLNEARVGDDTQQIEQDVIDQLKLMQEALKKAKQDLENKPSDSKPGDPNAKKPDNKLLEILAELKLIKSLQEQVNKRTVMHGKTDPNEQAKDPLIQAELNQLAARQKVLQDMLHKIATEANQ